LDFLIVNVQVLHELQLTSMFKFNTIVVGGGHAGLTTSYFLKQRKIAHLVFERHRIGNSWSSQRWNSFKLNTPNKYSCLPGFKNHQTRPDEFLFAKEFVSMLEQYAKEYNLPVVENSNVLAVERASDSELFQVTVSTNGKINRFRSNNVVAASGALSRKNIPVLSRDVPYGILQLHASEYRSAEDLHEGAVLVVGSGQSGVQIAEDLLDSGRKIFVSTSMVPRVPRRYRGRDVIEWMNLNGYLHERTEDVTDQQVFNMKPPQISGVGPRGKTISLQSLAKKGVTILGKTAGFDGIWAHFQPDAAIHVKFGDEFSQAAKNMIDEYIIKTRLDAPDPEPDEADSPDVNRVCASRKTTLNLSDHEVSTIIWCTGFDGDFNYLRLPVFNEDGTILHKGGIAEIEGLYFIGFPWLRKRQSMLIQGIEEDAEIISHRIKEMNPERMNAESQPHF